jgi:WD40 repeat protein
LETGKIKVFEGHTSWILAMKTYVKLKEDGSVKHQWLFSGSDDNTVRIWDISTTKCLEELQGHKNGIQTITFANNDLFTGSYDNYIICWSLTEIEEKIRETQAMMAEDLRSKKFEAFEGYMESKGKRKKGKAKGKGAKAKGGKKK